MLKRLLKLAMHLETNRRRGHEIEKGTCAVWDGGFKLMYDLGMGDALLFNLANDPGETDNLIDSESNVAEYFLGLLKDNLNKVNDRSFKSN